MGEEPRDHRDGGQLREFGRLETDAEFDPAFCPIVAVADVGDKAKEKKDGGEGVSDPREALKVMVVDHRGKTTEEETDPQPDDLSFKEKHGVSVAFGGKGRGARQHDQSEGDQCEDRADEKVDAGAMGFHEKELVDLFLKCQGFPWEKFFGIEAFVEFGQCFEVIGGEQIVGFYAVGLGNFRGIFASFNGVLFGADCGRFGGGVGQVGWTIWALGCGGGGVGERGNFCGASGGRLCGG